MPVLDGTVVLIRRHGAVVPRTVRQHAPRKVALGPDGGDAPVDEQPHACLGEPLRVGMRVGDDALLGSLTQCLGLFRGGIRGEGGGRTRGHDECGGEDGNGCGHFAEGNDWTPIPRMREVQGIVLFKVVDRQQI